MDQEKDDSNPGSPQETGATLIDPAVTFESITFSDGTRIDLQPTDVVVLVGPNNAGKSVALRQLEQHIEASSQQTVITGSTIRRVGSIDDVVTCLRNNTKERSASDGPTFVGYNIHMALRLVEAYWSGRNSIGELRPFFCRRLPTETRITDSNPASAIPTLDEPASHPIQMLYLDDDLEKRICGYFRQAFGEDLVVYRLGGKEIPILVGDNPSLVPGENYTSSSYCGRLRKSTIPLKEQGDGMRSFASVVLHLLAPITPSILLLDEPEAFLHPPQAKLLGELIAKERSSRAQLFVATHSPDVINGLLNVAPDNLRILRMRREGNVNLVKELDQERAKRINTDPLLRYSSVMSGVFHERVIVCESDSDCTFYNAIVNLPEIHGGREPDVLFVHASGKDRIPTLVETLRDLDVSVDVIVDIDILQSDAVLGQIVKALEGDWDRIGAMVKAVRRSIEDRKCSSSCAEIKRQIAEELEKLEEMPRNSEFPGNTRIEIGRIMKKSSPWFTVKAAGEAAIPHGQAAESFKLLKSLSNSIGLWIVPVGELEGFCRSVGGHGPRWVQEVMATRDLSGDAELRGVREFVREIWTTRQQPPSR